MDYLKFLPPFGLTLVLSVLFTRVVMKWGKERGYLDMPSPRRVHEQPTVRIGGLAIVAAFLSGLVIYSIWAPTKLNFVSERFWGIDKNLFGLILGGLIIAAEGLYDDIKKISPFKKLFWQVTAAIIIFVFGIRIFQIASPIGITWQLGVLGGLATVMWLTLLTNTVNYLDGIDGLATGVGLIAVVVLLLLSNIPWVNQPATALLCALLAGALLGFLPFNFHPAKIFLGDVGAQFIGFMIAIFALISGGKVATAALVLGIPLLDVIWVTGRRLMRGQPPFTPDKEHLHHRLLSVGLSQRQAVLFLYFIAATFGIIALLTKTQGKYQAGLWLAAVMVVLAVALVALQWRKNRREHES